MTQAGKALGQTDADKRQQLSSESSSHASLLHTAARGVGILRVLVRHGFIGALRGQRDWPSPVQVRTALEELGVVYLKFGQVLALRRDLLPAAYVDELAHLHDRLPPVDFEAVRTTVERELGAPLATLFSEFTRTPLAAATIAQVHTAVLTDGRSVVVKARRPGLEARAEEDLAMLTYLAAQVERLSPRLRALDPVGMVREFREILHREMDFRLEARTLQRFQAALDDPGIWIPDVITERSSAAVLTMEHSPGERVDRYAVAHPDAAPHLARKIAALVLHQVFETGLFHADPHPGNVFVLPDGRLCLHDFGMVGELDDSTRDSLAAMLEAVVRGDAPALTDAYLELGVVGHDIDRVALQQDLANLLRRVRELPLAEISVGEALEAMLRTGTRHRIRNPGAILLLSRAFLIAEALIRSLAPDLNVLTVFRDELGRIAVRRRSPARLAETMQHGARELERIAREGPAEFRRILRRVADGELGRIHVPELEALRRSSRSLERLTGAVGSSALLVAGALLARADGWLGWIGLGSLAIGLLGTLTTAIGALRSRDAP